MPFSLNLSATAGRWARDTLWWEPLPSGHPLIPSRFLEHTEPGFNPVWNPVGNNQSIQRSPDKGPVSYGSIEGKGDITGVGGASGCIVIQSPMVGKDYLNITLFTGKMK